MNEISPWDRINGSDLARQIGKSKQTVSHWRTGRYRVPAEMCRRIQEATGGVLSVHDLRPDIFGPAPGIAPAPGDSQDRAA